jgi:alkylation response protein AidB-like acyl-CoA dehydrogenase
MLDRAESKYENGTDEDKMGLKASPTSELIFNDVEVPAENLVGKEGEGFKIAMDSLNAGRISVAGQALAVAVAAYERAKKYVFERKQFGKRLGDFQAIQFMIADMSVDVEAARALIFRAIEFKYRGPEWYDHYIMASAQAKLFASEMSIRVTDKAVQVHGGYGYCKDYRVEEHYRAARIMPIIEGTSEIQRITIFRRLQKELGF